MMHSLSLPLRWVGPLAVRCGGNQPVEQTHIPLATYETPLWASVGRGAKVTREIGGVQALVTRDFMTRSLVMRVDNILLAHNLLKQWDTDLNLKKIARETGRFVELIDMQGKILGQTLFLRLSFTTGEASGHNMVTKAADAIFSYLVQAYPVTYCSVSGNLCVDKKTSAINPIQGRGKEVVVEGVISASVCAQLLKTTPDALHDLNIRKNYLGSLSAGSLCSANAHYANMLLAFYLATGQDAANIVEGSQGITTTDVIIKDEEKCLSFAVHLPNVIVGVRGNGKDSPQIQDHLQRLGCHPGHASGTSSLSQRLAMMIGASVWCGELSLLAAQTNVGELMRTHIQLERQLEQPMLQAPSQS